MTRKLTRAQFIATYDNSPRSRFCFCIPLNIGSVEDIAACNVISFSVHFALTLASFILVLGYIMDYHAQVILATSLFTIAFTSGIIVGMSIYLTNCSSQRIAMQSWLLATFLIAYIQFMTLAFMIGSILNEFGRPSRSEEDIESFVGLNGGHVIFYLVYIPVSIFTWILAIYSLLAVYFYLSVDMEESMKPIEPKPDPDHTSTNGTDEPGPKVINGNDEPERKSISIANKSLTEKEKEAIRNATDDWMKRKAETAKDRSGTKSAITDSDQIQTPTNGSDEPERKSRSIANESLTTKDREAIRNATDDWMKRKAETAKDRSGTKSAITDSDQIQTSTNGSDEPERKSISIANESLTAKDRESIKNATDDWMKRKAESDDSAKERSGTKSDHSAITEPVTSDKTKEDAKSKDAPLKHELDDQKHTKAPTKSESKQPDSTKEDEQIELPPLNEREKKAIDEAIKKYMTGKH